MPSSTTSKGRLSPIPPPSNGRVPSPNTSTIDLLARQTSVNGDAPRPSISSTRSLKRSEADFEAALLNPTRTIYLTGSPLLAQGEDSAMQSPGREGDGGAGGAGDHDASLPVEKRSYEEDLRRLARESKSAARSASGPPSASASGSGPRSAAGSAPAPPARESPAQNGATPTGPGETLARKESESSVGVIPPTPPHHKQQLATKMSHRTMGSMDSGTSASRMSAASGSSSARKTVVQSLGIDAELNEAQTMTGGSRGNKKGASKRKSIFRSPGTASSPDLATLVRKAKEAKEAGNGDAHGNTANGEAGPSANTQSIPQNAATTTTAAAATPARQAYHTRQAPLPPVPTSQSMGPATMGLAAVANGREAMSPTRLGAGRSVSGLPRAGMNASASGSEDGWDRFSDLRSFGSPSPEKMATISERTNGSRSRESSNDGSKSLRNKAKGMFGRMFGNSSRDHTPATSPSAPTAARFNSPQQPQPPVPPVPATYKRHVDDRQQATPSMSGSSAAAGSIASDAISPRPTALYDISPTMPTEARFQSDGDDGRRSITPTARSPAPPSLPADDQSLSDIHSSPSVPAPSMRSKADPKFGTMHRRQPADNFDETSRDSARRPAPSPRRPVTMSFSDDVAGIFDTIGQSEPAKELGLPPDSLRIRDRIGSADATVTRNRFPSELGRSLSIDSPRKESKLAVPGPVTQRKSSLPNGSPSSDTESKGTQRSPSSPLPSSSPLQSVGEGLVPPTSLSRSSSTSSRRRTKTDTAPIILETPDLGSPLDVDTVASDFGPIGFNADRTLRGSRDSDLPILSPASVRLVTNAARGVNGLHGDSRVSLVASGAWGRRSPSPAPREPSNETDNMEIVKTPTRATSGTGDEEEDDEEKGRRLACEFLDNDFSSMSSERVAEFLGGPRRVNAVALKYYMLYFDMKGQTLVESFRDLCAKLHLRAESQEIDRIIEGFSARYYDCNPTTVFGTPGVVHTVTGAMLMLNTDLHIADLAKHMSRADFVRNSMRAIQESMPTNDADASTPDLVRDDSGSVRLGPSASTQQAASTLRANRPSTSTSVPMSQRSASAPVVNSPQPLPRPDSDRSVSMAGQALADSKARGSSTTVGSFTYGKQWESEAENALKDIYNQVRADKILLPIGNNASSSNRQSMISLGNDSCNPTLRSPSGRSNDRINALKRGSIRGMQGLMNHPYGSGFSSPDGGLSPTGSYATSIGDTMNNFSATIGFASNLSHSVIREQEDESHSVASGASLDTIDEDLDDDELALLGAPWAKEGMLWRRTGTEAAMRKTSKKEWKQFFAVVQKGEMMLFTFGEGSGSASFGAVGGGNWLNNANAAGHYPLVHTTSVPLKGGYSKDRPYVFRMTLPNDETLYLAAGTDDLVTEWVNTCNYWSARRSRQPLQGGVSNMEYGWNRISDAAYHGHEDSHGGVEDDRASVRSARSNMSRFNTATYGRRSFSSNTPADRLHINDWKPPQRSMMPSPLDEEAQLDALSGYIKNISDDLASHRVLEAPMMKLYSPQSKNASKAHANWLAKNRFLTAEKARYDAYVDTLRDAIALRIKKQGEKKLEKSLQRSMTSLHRRGSEDSNGLLDRVGASTATSPGLPLGRTNGFKGRRDGPDGLRITSAGGRDLNGEDEEVARTPVAQYTRRQG